MWISDLSIRRPVFAWMLMLGLMFFGLVSLTRLGTGRLPDVDFPVVSVRLTWEGAAPEVMETDVVDIVEQALTGIQGIREISSNVMQGLANVSVEFDLDRDIDVAVQEIQTKLAGAQRFLPRELDPPIVTKTNPEDQPIIWIAASGKDVPTRHLMDYVQNHLQDRFTTIRGVGEVFLGGFLERNLRVWIDAQKLDEHELTVQDVIHAIQQGHSEIPAGRLETSSLEMNVRSMGEALNTEEFGNIVISSRGGRPVYKPIRIKDVARVEDGLADVRRISRKNGEMAVGMGIRKQRGSNEVAVGEAVEKRLQEIQSDIPPEFKVEITVNRMKFVKEAIHELKFTLILSAIITSIVCWMFLGSLSSTFNILLAIPTSVLGTFIVVYFLGFTLNTFTMMALSLGIGIIVDDAIMVLENIVRHRQMGLTNRQSSLQGARQIAAAAIAASLSIIAIFLPVAFMQGAIGKFFYQFGVTLSVAVAISLLEALTFTPMRCSQFLSVGERKSFLGKGLDQGMERLSQGYGNLLRRSLRRPGWIVFVSIIFFVASLGLMGLIKKEMLPSEDQSMLFIRLKTAPGSSIEFTDQKFKAVEKRLADRPEVKSFFAAVGGFGGGEVNSGQIIVSLKEPQDRPIVPPFKRRPSHLDFMNFLREDLKQVPQVKAVVQDPSLSGLSAQRGFPVEFMILGPQWSELAQYSELIEQRMNEDKIFTDVNNNFQAGVSEVRVVPDRKKASERGVSIESIGTTINALFAGERVGKYTQGGRRYDIRVRLIPSQRTQIQDIAELWVWNQFGERVQLKDVISIVEEKTPMTVTRQNRERAIKIQSNVATGQSQTDAVNRVKEIAAKILPSGYRLEMTGNTQIFKESFSGLWLVVWLGVLVAYMVLASQFNSYLDPFTILCAMPFSISGAFIALWITGQSINIYSFIGIVLLMGLVKKNSILLVEFANQLREQGKSYFDAMAEAGSIRLRPIIMTSLATVAAAIPPALSWGPGSEVFKPMATVVIGGITISTILTLVVIPCIYILLSPLRKTTVEP